MLHIVESRKPLDRIAKDLEDAVALYEEGEVRKLATITPTTLIGLFSTPSLKAVAEQVEATLEAIMAEAAR